MVKILLILGFISAMPVLVFSEEQTQASAATTSQSAAQPAVTTSGQTQAAQTATPAATTQAGVLSSGGTPSSDSSAQATIYPQGTGPGSTPQAGWAYPSGAGYPPSYQAAGNPPGIMPYAQGGVQPPTTQAQNTPGTSGAQTASPITTAFETTPRLSEEAAMEGIKVSEKQISLDLKGIDINDLLRILSLKMGLTIVSSKSVSGRINIFLNNLTFEDALDVILIIQDLACDRKGSIINIMTSSEYERLYGKKYNEKRNFASFRLNYAKPSTVFSALGQVKSDIGKVIVDEATGMIMMIDIPEKIELMEKTAKDLDKPPQTEVFDIKYAKAADLKTHLASAITPGTGEVYVDERSGKAIISDLPDKMKKLKKMFKAFDAETKEIFIEAEVIQITLKKEYQRQMNWEKAFKQKWLEGLDLKGTFPVNASFTPSPGFSTANFQLTMGTLTRDWNTETYKFLETFGDVKILSSPRLSVVNNQEAKVLVGSREVYVTTSQSQAQTTTVTSESVQFIDVGTKLNVVPTINEDGYITMKIKPEVSSVRETLTTTLGSKIPIVETAEAETIVKVKDGTTIMIAGMIKQEKRKDTTGWPFLQSIPILGAFFGSRADQDKRTEVIVFLTPHIIKGDKMFSGKELQKLVPADIVSEELKDNIMHSAVEEEIEKGVTGEREKQKRSIDSVVNTKENQFLPVQRQDNAVGTAIQGKIKGLKEY